MAFNKASRFAEGLRNDSTMVRYLRNPTPESYLAQRVYSKVRYGIQTRCPVPQLDTVLYYSVQSQATCQWSTVNCQSVNFSSTLSLLPPRHKIVERRHLQHTIQRGPQPARPEALAFAWRRRCAIPFLPPKCSTRLAPVQPLPASRHLVLPPPIVSFPIKL